MKTSGKSLFCAAIAGACLLLPGAAFAREAGVTLSSPWIRSIIPSRPAAAYFTLKNTGDTPKSLVGASSPGCAMMMLHQSKQVNGVDKMLPVKTVTIAAHGSVAFAPGGYHAMCMKPTDAVKPGKSVEVTLTFADGGTISASFPVKNAAGK